MPELADYEPYAPFGLSHLVEAANSLLSGRRQLHVSPRTVRYYIAQGLVEPPIGSPKFARYEMSHLVRIVLIRILQDQGKPLSALEGTLGRISIDEAQVMLDKFMAQPERHWVSEVRDEVAPPASPLLMEAPRSPIVRERRQEVLTLHRELSLDTSSPVHRIRLEPDIVLEIPATGNPAEHLERAYEALEKYL